MYINTRILNNIKVFKQSFPESFLREVTYCMIQETYSIDDIIFKEGDPGSRIYYLLSGSISLVHHESKTFISELQEKSYFGEIAFFTGD